MGVGQLLPHEISCGATAYTSSNNGYLGLLEGTSGAACPDQQNQPEHHLARHASIWRVPASRSKSCSSLGRGITIKEPLCQRYRHWRYLLHSIRRQKSASACHAKILAKQLLRAMWACSITEWSLHSFCAGGRPPTSCEEHVTPGKSPDDRA